jgi:hypothetical protein
MRVIFQFWAAATLVVAFPTRLICQYESAVGMRRMSLRNLDRLPIQVDLPQGE